MTYVVTQACCNDASCVSVCPVNCIHPAPGEPDFGHTEMVYVDPRTCIDCGACADACPVSAIKPLDALRGDEQVFGDLNSAYYDDRPAETDWAPPTFPVVRAEREQPLRVATVGTGPAASYTARELLTTSPAQISMIDRLPVTGGLVRAGVAPDHQDTKRLTDMFAWTYEHPRTRMFLNVELGTDVSHDDLLRHHDAVVYAVGARTDRELGVPGEHLRGVHGSPEVVGWYNSHTDVAPDAVSLSTERVVIVGTGNVALDLARILLGDADALARTDISDHALEALRSAPVREVVLLGRRGPDQAAFTRPELLMMPAGIDVVVEADEGTARSIAEAAPGSKAALLAGFPQTPVDWTSPPPDGRRLVLAFHRVVDEVLGEETVESVRLASTRADRDPVTVPAGLLIRSTGLRGSPVPGLPFDELTSTVPHQGGRVVDPATGAPVPGAYVAGWIKRGALGGIGANRQDAAETVATLLADDRDGALPQPRGRRGSFAAMLRTRGIDVVDKRRMSRIEAAERAGGQAQGRPRVKFSSVDDMLRHRR
jgi:ferredoxin--NADP+ reductase